MDHLTPGRWQRIDALFTEALERPPAERGAFVASACADDSEIREAVMQLLDDARAAEAALGESAAEYAEPFLIEMSAALEREDLAGLPENGRVGPYRILREIGRGGMGAVFLAERADGAFEKQVALKLVKRGMDTDEVLRRFRHERQILASLEHPYIARLYDGGVAEDERPYLVMEHIEGVPITRYCDERRLRVDERLDLFARVCEAVEFAHRALVIHRDIKPSNILVTADGTPKLLDFGIAKLLDPATAGGVRTRTEARLLTPEYAAPEQAAGGPITTASDVYALGVVMYELLAGRRPGGRSRRPEYGAAAVERPSTAVTRSADARQGSGPASVAEVAGRRGTSPDRLCRRLRGDLDTIALRALAPEPERRYGSVERLAADIARHLQGLPVEARGDSPGYRARKFVRRNRVAVFAGALVALSLALGLAATVSQARVAVRERDTAQRERARAEQVSGFLLGLFEAANPDAARPEGADTLRARHLLDLGVQRVRRELAAQPQLQAEMLATLGRIYGSLGDYPAGESLLRDALALQGAAPRERATTLALLGELYRKRGEYALADSLYREVLGLYSSRRWGADSLYVFSLSERGGALHSLGRSEEAAALHRQAHEQVGASNGRSGLLYAHVINNFAEFRYGLGEYAEAEGLFRETVQVYRRRLGSNHPSLAEGLNNLASSIHYQERYDEAEPLYLEAVAIARRTHGEVHPDVGQFTENLATLYDDQGEYARAEPKHRTAIAIHEATLGRRSVLTALTLHNLAINRFEFGELSEAEALDREAAATLRDQLGGDHLYTALAHLTLGRTLTAIGQTGEALPLLRSVVAVVERDLPAGHYRIHMARGYLAGCLAAMGEYALAEPLLLASYAALREQKGDAYYVARSLREDLHRLYTRLGQPEKAREYAGAGSTADDAAGIVR